jgi:hypothetical protein
MSPLISSTSKETLATAIITKFLAEKNDAPDGNQIVFNSTLSVVLENPGMRKSVEKLLVRANFSRANIHRIIGNESILDVYIVDNQNEYQDTSILDDMFYQLFQKSSLLLKLVSMAEDISLDRKY